jgi:hypothetical protein
MKTPIIKFKFDRALLNSWRSNLKKDQVLEFDLFLISREIKQTTQELSKINLLPDSEKQSWLAENEALVSFFMSDLLSELKDVFLDLSLKQGTAEEAMSCVSHLQELTEVVEHLISDSREDLSASATTGLPN